VPPVHRPRNAGWARGERTDEGTADIGAADSARGRDDSLSRVRERAGLRARRYRDRSHFDLNPV
jgi:hypothetical protein